MIKLCDTDQCTGCGACRNICPTNSIRMQTNQEGFYYPSILEKQCVKCRACEKVCPVTHPVSGEEFRKAYKASHASREIREESSSGGMFTALAEAVLARGGTVFAARYSDDYMHVFHSAAEQSDELAPFRGSKYVQSRIDLCFREIKERIDGKQTVLFVGTPCQVAGLRSFLRGNTEGLFLVDFICHGVISEKVFQLYFTEQLRRDEHLLSFSFRDKGHGNGYVNNHAIYYKTDLGREYSAGFDDDLLGFGFAQNLLSRSSCSTCSYASPKRVSDLTLCDYPWDLTEEQRKYGASGVLVNTKKGEELLNCVLDRCELQEIPRDTMIGHQLHLRSSSVMHKNRAVFFRHLEEGFSKSAQRYFSPYVPKVSLKTRAVRKLRRLIKKL